MFLCEVIYGIIAEKQSLEFKASSLELEDQSLELKFKLGEVMDEHKAGLQL